MSIRIDKTACVGCGKCKEVCPGNLIKQDENNKAFIRRVEDCWGCTACLKECGAGAISYFLGADIGGRGSTLTTWMQGSLRHWVVHRPDGSTEEITVDMRESNKY